MTIFSIITLHAITLSKMPFSKVTLSKVHSAKLYSTMRHFALWHSSLWHSAKWHSAPLSQFNDSQNNGNRYNDNQHKYNQINYKIFVQKLYWSYLGVQVLITAVKSFIAPLLQKWQWHSGQTLTSSSQGQGFSSQAWLKPIKIQNSVLFQHFLFSLNTHYFPFVDR